MMSNHSRALPTEEATTARRIRDRSSVLTSSVLVVEVLTRWLRSCRGR